MAQSLGPAFLMLFVLTTGQSPQYRDVPGWLRWLSWLSPTAYAYEGAMVNELNGRTVVIDGVEVPGSVYGEQALGLPRIPYKQAPGAMSTESGIVSFDIYMLVVLWFFFEIVGFALLSLSRNWYGPSTKRYQVVSGMSLAAPRPGWLAGDNKDQETRNDMVPVAIAEDESSIPKAPRVHMTACNIIYEVDIPIVDDGGEDDKRKSQSIDVENDVDGDYSKNGREESNIIDSDEKQLQTALEYGQVGRGRASEWIISRRLGNGAISSSARSTTRSSAATGSIASKAGDGTGSSFALQAPAPGRLRLLTGITASFEPGTMTALMGSSGAGKTTLLDVLAGYKTGGHISGDIRLNGHPKTDTSWRAIAGYCEQGKHFHMILCPS
jgi:ABC-type multidrug transport system fused ATPase/permease subunit